MNDYKRMFEMKQDDWFDACKDISRLEAENARLRETLKVAEEALEYYQNYIPGHRMITPESAAYEKELGVGRRAREALAEIRDKK
jgi:hypothetical protein